MAAINERSPLAGGYVLHETARALPEMDEETYRTLKESIRAEGQMQPILIWRNQVIDGRHRLRACRELQIEPLVQRLPDDIDPYAFAQHINLSRRSLAEGQRVLIAARMHMLKEGRANLAGYSDRDLAEVAGTSTSTAHRARQVLSIAPEAVQQAVIAGVISLNDAASHAGEPHSMQERALAMVQSGESRNLRGAFNRIRREELASDPPPLPDGRFRTVVIDPPWPMEKIQREVRPNQVGFDYPTMSVEEIAGMDVPGLLWDDAFVFLWTTQKFLPDAFDILARWGVKYRFTMVWHKPGGIQPYGLPQYNAEFVLAAAQGNPNFLDTTGFPVAFNAPRGRHSEKPEEFYELVARVTAGPRVDMFARRDRREQGFEVWGNEV